jgi:hypothetical protein
MSDLVKKLRDPFDALAMVERQQAADRIEELERENADLRMQLDASCNAEELRQVRAENAALKETERKFGTLMHKLMDEAAALKTKLLPKEPPPGLLVSMAIRMDHGLGVPGYYDQGMSIESHTSRMKSTITVCRQLYEEVSGYGFYKPELESHYAAIDSARSNRD